MSSATPETSAHGKPNFMEANHETHQHSRLHSMCEFRFDGMGAAASSRAAREQTFYSSSGTQLVQESKRNTH